MSVPCFDCGGVGAHMHHVVPRSLGGAATVPLCEACHGKAHGSQGFRRTGELTRNALRRLRDSGFVFGGAPFGYRYSRVVDSSGRRRLEVDSVERAALDRLIALRAEGYSIRRLADAANKLGIPTRGGGAWHPTTIARAISQGKDVVPAALPAMGQWAAPIRAAERVDFGPLFGGAR